MASSNQLPVEIRKYCLMLGIAPTELSMQSLQQAWAKRVSTDGVHTESGGDDDSLLELNQAREALLKYLSGLP